IQALHTPGHREELMSLLLIDTERSERPAAVFTGDSMLVGDAGRPDFGGGDAEAQYRSIQRLLELDDYVMLLPGHFEGPCGAGLNGMACSTIGYERRFSPVACLTHDQFVTRLSTEIPPRPLNMTAIEATNRGLIDAEWAMPIDRTTIPGIPPAELSAHAGAFLLDVREPVEYRVGHVPGSVNIPQADLASRIEELPRDREIIVICQAGRRSLRAGTFLADRGFPNIVNLGGGTNAWLEANLPVEFGLATPGDADRQPLAARS
ncbi:MAG: rhodanese-like domain-containing protein, partial [Thermomicrobiales bacterium]